ncbi:hypothetical protein SAMN05518669_13515 [Variovorax sp. YR634]|uniref:helix-turn-helix transcriptional regulator n=1 Tax=Variovorax sp. YR634 TaxID=1884385 RepID=UPI0008951D07|nr:hypothetical protein [Variovorax sp. YR634]SDZ43316.1 hypothetical protein SAMN05518669_13515 [Variovorax sp. YR634]
MTARNTTLPTDSKQSPHIPLPLPAYLRESQVLQSLPISKSSLWRLVAADKLKVVRISKRMTLFSAQSVLDYLEECEKKGRE